MGRKVTRCQPGDVARQRGRTSDLITLRELSSEPRPKVDGMLRHRLGTRGQWSTARAPPVARSSRRGAPRSRNRGRCRAPYWFLFTDRGCSVVVTEARAENVAELRCPLPTVDAREADVEESMEYLGRFDIVFCYRVLYTSRVRCGLSATWPPSATTSC